MSLHEFIFSGERRHRISRHVAFWLGWMMFASMAQLTGLGNLPLPSIKDKILFQLLRSFNRLVPQILFCYAVVYFLVPRFLARKKYLQFTIWVIVFFAMLVVLTYFWFYVNNGLTDVIFGLNVFNPFITKFFSFYSNINFTGPIPACCLILAFKYYKDWDKKQRDGEVLIRENIQAELQLLKAQIHPHFLFNTLNNIYAFTLTGSPQAAALVDKLSGMIDYIIIEGEKPLVSLEKEIQVVKDYIGLEKVRYGDRLEMMVEIKGNYKNKLIAPLIMIPFVENCFKHGASIMRGQQWINLAIGINDNRMDFCISNSKPANEKVLGNKKGIGLANVHKRLELLYPGKHLLITESLNETYSVKLSINLQDTVEAEPGPDRYNLQAVKHD